MHWLRALGRAQTSKTFCIFPIKSAITSTRHRQGALRAQMEKAKTGSNGGGWSRHTQDNGVKHWEENKNFFPSAPALLRPHLLCVAHSVCVYMRRRDPQRHRPKGPILRRPSANNPIPFPLWYPKGMAASRDFAGSRVTAFDVLVCW